MNQRASEIALDWIRSDRSTAKYGDLTGLVGWFVAHVDSECVRHGIRPLDKYAKARSLLLICYCLAGVQELLFNSHPVVQILATRRPELVGSRTQNASSCLESDLRKIRDLLDRLGALCGVLLLCCARCRGCCR